MPRSSRAHAMAATEAARRAEAAAELARQEVQQGTATAMAELARREAALNARSQALDERERAVIEREARVDSRAAALEHGIDVDLVWALPAAAAANQIRNLMIDTGDDVASVARGIGVDAEWARGVLTGEITEVDIDHVQQLCEGLHCTPYDLFGSEAGRSIAHAYGPDLWPRYIEPLEPLAWSGDDFHPELLGEAAGADSVPELGVELDP